MKGYNILGGKWLLSHIYYFCKRQFNHSMSFKALFLSIISLFLFQSIHAQDTAKHVEKSSKHKMKHAAKDSSKIKITESVVHINDTARSHKKDTSSRHKYPRDGYVAINGGFGIPNGDFSSTGNATGGKIFSISAGFPGIISHCGIAFKFDEGTNGMNQTGLLGMLSSQNGFPNIHYSIAGVWGKYSYKTLLTGLYLTYPNKYFTVDGRVLFGAMFASIPSLSVNYKDSAGNTGTYYQAKTSGSAFAMDMGIEVRYAVMAKLSVMLSIDYLHAVPTFNYVTTGAGLTPVGSIEQETGRQASSDQPFDLYSFTLGVGYTIYAQKPTPPIK
jgi:hypothetical protein